MKISSPVFLIANAAMFMVAGAAMTAYTMADEKESDPDEEELCAIAGASEYEPAEGEGDGGLVCHSDNVHIGEDDEMKIRYQATIYVRTGGTNCEF